MEQESAESGFTHLEMVASLLGERYDSAFWEELAQNIGPIETAKTIERLKRELEEAKSEEAKTRVRQAWSKFVY